MKRKITVKKSTDSKPLVNQTSKNPCGLSPDSVVRIGPELENFLQQAEELARHLDNLEHPLPNGFSVCFDVGGPGLKITICTYENQLGEIVVLKARWEALDITADTILNAGGPSECRVYSWQSVIEWIGELIVRLTEREAWALVAIRAAVAARNERLAAM